MNNDKTKSNSCSIESILMNYQEIYIETLNSFNYQSSLNEFTKILQSLSSAAPDAQQIKTKLYELFVVTLDNFINTNLTITEHFQTTLSDVHQLNLRFVREINKLSSNLKEFTKTTRNQYKSLIQTPQTDTIYYKKLDTQIVSFYDTSKDVFKNIKNIYTPNLSSQAQAKENQNQNQNPNANTNEKGKGKAKTKENSVLDISNNKISHLSRNLKNSSSNTKFFKSYTTKKQKNLSLNCLDNYISTNQTSTTVFNENQGKTNKLNNKSLLKNCHANNSISLTKSAPSMNLRARTKDMSRSRALRHSSNVDYDNSINIINNNNNNNRSVSIIEWTENVKNFLKEMESWQLAIVNKDKHVSNWKKQFERTKKSLSRKVDSLLNNNDNCNDNNDNNWYLKNKTRGSAMPTNNDDEQPSNSMNNTNTNTNTKNNTNTNSNNTTVIEKLKAEIIELQSEIKSWDNTITELSWEKVEMLSVNERIKKALGEKELENKQLQLQLKGTESWFESIKSKITRLHNWTKTALVNRNSIESEVTANSCNQEILKNQSDISSSNLKKYDDFLSEVSTYWATHETCMTETLTKLNEIIKLIPPTSTANNANLNNSELSSSQTHIIHCNNYPINLLDSSKTYTSNNSVSKATINNANNPNKAKITFDAWYSHIDKLKTSVAEQNELWEKMKTENIEYEKSIKSLREKYNEAKKMQLSNQSKNEISTDDTNWNRGFGVTFGLGLQADIVDINKELMECNKCWQEKNVKLKSSIEKLIAIDDDNDNDDGNNGISNEMKAGKFKELKQWYKDEKEFNKRFSIEYIKYLKSIHEKISQMWMDEQHVKDNKWKEEIIVKMQEKIVNIIESIDRNAITNEMKNILYILQKYTQAYSTVGKQQKKK